MGKYMSDMSIVFIILIAAMIPILGVMAAYFRALGREDFKKDLFNKAVFKPFILSKATKFGVQYIQINKVDSIHPKDKNDNGGDQFFYTLEDIEKRMEAARAAANAAAYSAANAAAMSARLAASWSALAAAWSASNSAALSAAKSALWSSSSAAAHSVASLSAADSASWSARSAARAAAEKEEKKQQITIIKEMLNEN